MDKSLSLLLLLFLFLSCGSRPTDVTQSDTQPEIYPDYVAVTIPAGIAPLCFAMADETVDCIDVEVRGSKGGHLHANGEWADFDLDDWRQLTLQNRGGRLTLSVTARRQGQWTRYHDFDILVSADALDDYGVTYRRIAPGYEVGGDIGIYQRDIHSFQEKALLTETAVPGRCMNCHTPNHTDPSLFTLQIRGTGGGTLIQKDGQQRWYDTKTDSTKAAGSYASWHPSGHFCAYAANAVHQAFFVGTGQRIEVYHSFSNIVVLNLNTNELLTAPALQTSDLEIFPAFSADGKTLYYSTSQPCRLPAEYERVKCSLCAIPFDATTGRFGSEVDTLLNGPATDKSYTLARPSYDGRWLMYCQSSRSNFPVAQTDADLCLLNLLTGEHRLLSEVNSCETESWHSWSDNSQWFVFVSKREDGMYARLYFAHIDRQGRVSKPFLLPQRNPRQYYRALMDSYNVPEFTRSEVTLDAHEAYRQVFRDERIGVRIK